MRPTPGVIVPAVGMLSLAVIASTGCAHATHVATPRPAASEQTRDGLAALTKGEPIDTEDLGFAIDRPAGEQWAVATGMASPDGNTLPVVVAHPDSGAQLVVQVKAATDSPEQMTKLLQKRLTQEMKISLSPPGPVVLDAGGEAYGFDFRVPGEAAGRVAIVTVGDQAVLVVASWPEKVDPDVIRQLDQVVRSVRPAGTSSPVLERPDKA